MGNGGPKSILATAEILPQSFQNIILGYSEPFPFPQARGNQVVSGIRRETKSTWKSGKPFCQNNRALWFRNHRHNITGRISRTVLVDLGSPLFSTGLWESTGSELNTCARLRTGTSPLRNTQHHVRHHGSAPGSGHRRERQGEGRRRIILPRRSIPGPRGGRPCRARSRPCTAARVPAPASAPRRPSRHRPTCPPVRPPRTASSGERERSKEVAETGRVAAGSSIHKSGWMQN
jgi:hypothetical protein